MEFTQADLDLINAEFEELRLAALKRCSSQEEYDGVLKAFEFANEAHKGVRRRSGDPYIIHPISVAKIVVSEIGLGYKSIVAALLHDTVEDTEITIEDIKRLFGDKIASLVDGLTKIKAAMNKEDSLQAENFKRIILTLNDDVRVILIKLADRLHNIRTIDAMPAYKKEKILSETMYVFVPLAHRLGLYKIKSEMENIWFINKEPKAYAQISGQIEDMVKQCGAAMDEFIRPISETLHNNGYRFEIFKRTKSPYSIWYKMQQKGVDFDSVYDKYAVRIIFQPKEHEEERIQCWYIYTLITGIYRSKTERIRDWVTNPKSNGYEALHCTVMSNNGTWIEIQIRSERMNAIAEKGVAAHWNYKKIHPNDGKSLDKEMDSWLDMVRDVIENPDVNALEFLDHFHDSLLDSEIYVFTPKGDSKVLPKGATALDFAYSIHSEIGNKAIAAKVNLKLEPLSRILKNGDQVEIITAESQKPQREWLDFLKTSKAKNYVTQALIEDINGSIKAGREMLEKELAKYNVKLQKNVIKKLIGEYNVASKEELYNKISGNIISLDNLEKILKKNNQNKNVIYWTLHLFKNKEKEPEDVEKDDEGDVEGDPMTSVDIGKKTHPLGKGRDFILAENPIQHTLTYRAADCCYPIPGDSVIGFLTDSGEVIIHKKSCPKAQDLGSTQGDRIVNARWDKHTVLSFLARVKVLGVDRIGILNELTKCSTLLLNINIRKVLIETHDGIFEGYIDFYVHNIEDLETLISHIKKIKGIESVNRIDIKENLK